MEIKIELNLECDIASERSPDELYVTTGIVHSNGVASSRCVWEGRITDEDPQKKCELTVEIWKGEVPPGGVSALIVNLIEQDSTGWDSGVEFAQQLAAKVGGCIAQAEESNALQALEDLDLSPFVKRATSAFGSLKDDDLLGSFMLALSHSTQGQIQGKVYPIASANFLEDGSLVLSGGGSVYLADPIINGRPVIPR